jgi:uncharacterized membrane protein
VNALQWAKTYFVALGIFLALDMAWLGFAAKGFYARSMSPVVEMAVNWPAAILFYTLYVVGIVLFALRPALAAGSAGSAALWGALFGFFTYATYDLTNLATVKDWPATLVFVDILWGTFLCTAVSVGAYLVCGKAA